MQIDWDMIRAMYGPAAPGWALVKDDWMWKSFVAGGWFAAAVILCSLWFWIEWLFSGKKEASS